MKEPAVYILASKRNGTLYIGVTSNLEQRLYEHKVGQGSAFAFRYRFDLLVYCEFFRDMGAAIRREKQLKKWRREWKVTLIEKRNPLWADLLRSYGSWIPDT